MSAVAEIDGVSARRHYVIGLLTDYHEGVLGPELQFTVEYALEQDPILASYFESYERAIAIARETVRSRTTSQSRLNPLLTFLRDNLRKNC